MKILSWNVNSVRLRMRALGRIVQGHRPDVLCLQETKVQDGGKGRRLDHAWVTPGLLDGLVDARVLENVRGWKMPSDHAPVLLSLDA